MSAAVSPITYIFLSHSSIISQTLYADNRTALQLGKLP
jgi:hypothetical protein